MAEFKHLVIVRFKEGAEVEEILKGMEKLASEVDLVKSFECGQKFYSAYIVSSPYDVPCFCLSRGQDKEGPEMLTQGFTHAFTMTFEKKEEYIAFQTHPNHVEYSAAFSAAIEKIVVLDFPSVVVKPPPA